MAVTHLSVAMHTLSYARIHMHVLLGALQGSQRARAIEADFHNARWHMWGVLQSAQRAHETRQEICSKGGKVLELHSAMVLATFTIPSGALQSAQLRPYGFLEVSGGG